MHLSKPLFLAGALLGAVGAPALADGDAAAPGAAADQLTVPKGRALLDAELEMSLSKGAAFQPVSLSPDLWYGVDDKLTVGLVHSTLGATGFIGAAGDSLCLTGSSNGCAHVYPGLGLDARYGLATGAMAWAIDGGVYARELDPFQLSIKLGVAGRWHSGKLAVEFDPNIFIGLTNRTPMTGPANGETLAIPVTGAYDVATKVALLAQTGVILPFDDAGKLFAIPLSIGARYRASDHLGIGLAFSLPVLAGGSAQDTGIDARTLTIGGDYAF